MERIGLITYHSAYNFGSFLQAYATQKILGDLCGNCKVINYRTKEQKRIYAIFVWNKNQNLFKNIAKNILILPDLQKRVRRQNKYETDIRKYFDLTNEYEEPEEINWNDFDCVISGSDQIWNKHSNELHNIDWAYMMPYLLRGFKGKKISYASSFPNMSSDEIELIKPELVCFNAISVRERSNVNVLQNMLNADVTYVLDPTFLLSREQWCEDLSLTYNPQNYILYYALNKRKSIKANIDKVLAYSNIIGSSVKVISPLGLPVKNKKIETIMDADPIDFLNLILNARVIITDSYHGTIFSINFQKEFYSINGNNVSDSRKVDILTQLGLFDRSVTTIDDILKRERSSINYLEVNDKLKDLKDSSISYLRNNLNE